MFFPLSLKMPFLDNYLPNLRYLIYLTLPITNQRRLFFFFFNYAPNLTNVQTFHHSINQSIPHLYTSKRREKNPPTHFSPFYCCCALLTLFFCYLSNKFTHLPKPEFTCRNHTPTQGILLTWSDHTSTHCLLAKEKNSNGQKEGRKWKEKKELKENKFKRKELKHP